MGGTDGSLIRDSRDLTLDRGGEPANKPSRMRQIRSCGPEDFYKGRPPPSGLLTPKTPPSKMQLFQFFLM
jgi:hypothetical protein